MKLVINGEAAKNCLDRHLTLDEVGYMFSVMLEEDWGIKLSDGALNKLAALGLYNDRLGCLTLSGIDLVVSLSDAGDRAPKAAEYTEEFDEFWEEYPVTDAHAQWGVSRKIRGRDKARAYQQYLQCIASGDTPEEILEGLRAEVLFRKETSIRENNLKFMKSPVNFLSLGVYKDYRNDNKKSNGGFEKIYGGDLA
jgi:hypothetical protein